MFILANGVVEQVRAKEIHANIRGTDSHPTDPLRDSFIYSIGEIKTNGQTGGTGDFFGEIRAELLGKSGLRVFSGIGADITIDGEMQGRVWLQRTNSAGNEIFISRTPEAGASPGLRSTIVYNCIDLSEGPSAWGLPDSVTLASNVLSPTSDPDRIILQHTADPGTDDSDGYSPLRSAASLGGGAVGVMPVIQHRDDSFPLDGQIILDMNARP